ncbi:MAG: NAD-binding protein [Candidatus Pacebacteria bacterium]|nr:NAD-binding protein [Candidatus Paceibacterota bacterium]
METNIIEEKEIRKIYKTIIFGYGRAGLAFVKAVKKENLSYLVVDYNPDTAKDMRGENINFKYGDADDIEFLNEIQFTKAKLIISTIPNINTNLLLLSEYGKKNRTGDIIIFAQNKREAERLYENGASYVIIPHYLGANHISQILENAENGKYNFEKVKKIQSRL